MYLMRMPRVSWPDTAAARFIADWYLMLFLYNRNAEVAVFFDKIRKKEQILGHNDARKTRIISGFLLTESVKVFIVELGLI